MRRPRLDFTGRLSLGPVLLAMLPLGSQAELSRQSPSYPVSIEVQMQTQVAWGSTEWQDFTGEVEHIWAPYGLTLCWTQRANPCAGWGPHLTVVITDDLPPTARSARLLQPVLGRILFDDGRPRTGIALSMTAARWLVTQARVGDERLQGWPSGTWEALVPRVLGRALAHEIGHYVLQSRGHTRRGLMSPTFRPYEVTFGPTSWFRLTPDAVSALHLQCPMDRAAAERGPASSAHGEIC